MPLLTKCPKCREDVDVDTEDYRIRCPTCGHQFD